MSKKLAIEEKISRQVENAVRILLERYPDKKELFSSGDIKIDIPRDMLHGDFTTNIAMRLVKILKANPMTIAQEITSSILQAVESSDDAGMFTKIEAAKPGFINFHLSAKFLTDNLKNVNSTGSEYGSSDKGKGIKLQIEFVSANPTGPLTVAHGRQAAVGDALANIMRFCGYDVTKEYFINDEGRQINVLGESILHHYLALFGIAYPFPEDGYKGVYVKDIAQDIKDKAGDKYTSNYADSKQFFRDYGVQFIMDIIHKDLDEFNVKFDSWFSQRNITRELIMDTLDGLRKNGMVFDNEGAVWFRSTAFGDEKDRVVIKSDGAFTYFAPDIAYHKNKFSRGFNMLVNIWGPDHHGYIPRIKAAVRALGSDPDALSVLIVQLATLYRNGQVVSMSTRMGEFITLKEVCDEVGKDVTTFIFLTRKLDSHLDFDLEVAKKESQDNPVYYIQYAHARIWSIIEFSGKIGKEVENAALKLDMLKEKEETDLMRVIVQFPAYVSDSASALEPYYIILYLNNLASLFHNFYTKHKVVTDNPELSKARLFLIDAVRTCLANGLNLLGVSLPKKM